MLKMEGSNYQPIRWADPKAVEVGNWVATPGLGTEPVAVGVISVGARKVSTRDLPPARNDSGFLGVALETAEGAVRITSVEPKSPAEKAGIKTGDLVTTIAGKVIQTSESMIENVQRYKAGDEVILKIKRGMEELDFKCVLARRPLDRAAEQNSMGNENSLRRGGFPTILQHDTVLKPVDCGGPLVDLDGQAVGINIARAGRTETYAVPASDVLALLPQLKSGTLLPESLKKETLASSNVQSLRSELEKAESDLKGLIQKIQENRNQDNNELKTALNKVKKLRDDLDKVEIETIKVKK
jgi:serine protease Do